MAGLRKLCKMYGGMTIQGVKWVWDYVADEPVKESEMPVGSERWKDSEKAKYLPIIKEAERKKEDGTY